MPPASETTSGRLATANSARISDAVMPAARAANRSTGRPGSIDVSGGRSGSGTGMKASTVAAGWRHGALDRTSVGRIGAAMTVRV